MSRSTRLFEVIQILRRAETPVTAQAMADTLEVAKRTIYRDIAALQAMRVPIDGEAGIGYILRSGFDLPPLMFSQDEIEAIVVGLALLGRTGDRGLERAAESAASKISDVIPEDAQRAVPLHVSLWNPMPQTNVETADLRRHIRDASELKIAYLDLKDRRTNRDIRPVALIYFIEVVILAAWCELRQAFRHFRVDRIEQCRPTGLRFADSARALRTAWETETGVGKLEKAEEAGRAALSGRIF